LHKSASAGFERLKKTAMQLLGRLGAPGVLF